ncbi:hypothetical protein GOP47_0030651, partial [Adiantum capillus-veneris]
MLLLEYAGDALPPPSRLDVFRQLCQGSSISQLNLCILMLLSCLEPTTMPPNVAICVAVKTLGTSLSITI